MIPVDTMPLDFAIGLGILVLLLVVGTLGFWCADSRMFRRCSKCGSRLSSKSATWCSGCAINPVGEHLHSRCSACGGVTTEATWEQRGKAL